VTIIVNIFKDERFYLEKLGYKMHEHIFPTHGTYLHYLCIDSGKVFADLMKYRESKITYRKG